MKNNKPLIDLTPQPIDRMEALADRLEIVIENRLEAVIEKLELFMCDVEGDA